MEKQQTAVEWLTELLMNGNTIDNKIIQQALTMEREQITKAHEMATREVGFEAAAEDWAKEYWERTFNAK